MYSDLPAKDVLASHLAATSKAKEEELGSVPQTSNDGVTYLQTVGVWHTHTHTHTHTLPAIF